MPSTRPACFLAIILTFLLLVAPGTWTSDFAGSPLTPAGRIVFAGLFVLFWACVLIKPARRMSWIVPGVLAGLVAIKLLLASFSVPNGFQGVYRSDAADAPPANFVARFHQDPFRVDPTLAFDGRAFGLHFLNDFQKYGHKFVGTRRDYEYPLFVTWTGYVRLDEPSPLEFGISSFGRVHVTIDGATLYDQNNPPGAGSQVLTSPVLPAGQRRIVVQYDKPANTDPVIWVQVFHPTRNVRITPWPASAETVARQELFASLNTLSVVLGLIALGVGLIRAYTPNAGADASPASPLAGAATVSGKAVLIGPLAALSVLIGITTQVLIMAAPYPGLTEDLTAGNDWLAYEGNARDILHHGLLMAGGKPLGQGNPYFFYPFFPYVLAAGHALIGEDYGAVVLVNGLAVASLAPLCWLLGWRDTRPAVALVGLAGLALFCSLHLTRYAAVALSDCVFIAIAFTALLACRTALERWNARYWVIAGILMAMAAATRPNFLTFVPLFAVSVTLLWYGGTLFSRGGRAALLAAGFIIGVAPFTLRNLIVSGKVVMLVNSWVQIPYFLVPPGLPNPVSSAGNTTLGSSVALAARMFSEDPMGIIWIETRKVMFTLGFTQPPFGITDVHRPHWDLVVLSILFVTALALRRLKGPLAFVLCVFAVSHIAAMVLAAPWTYGYKTILPLHAAFLVGAAHLLVPGRVSARSGVPASSAIADVPHSLRV